MTASQPNPLSCLEERLSRLLAALERSAGPSVAIRGQLDHTLTDGAARALEIEGAHHRLGQRVDELAGRDRLNRAEAQELVWLVRDQRTLAVEAVQTRKLLTEARARMSRDGTQRSAV